MTWLQGGPGCSDLLGLINENGPFLWQPGTLLPTPNPYSWSNLTNMLYVDQPIGVGYSQGTPDISNDFDMAKEFMGFYKNFIDTFDLHGSDAYITGESFGGVFASYIADGMLRANDKKYYNVKGMMINDPAIGDFTSQQDVPLVPYVEYWQKALVFNDTFMAEIRQTADDCNFTSYFDMYLSFPPPQGIFPPSPDLTIPGCDIFETVYYTAVNQNPCFNVYHITDGCPLLPSVLGDPNGGYEPSQLVLYFNRSDVQAQLHVPPTSWIVCNYNNLYPGPDGKNPYDTSDFPTQNGIFTNIIERTNNVIVASGKLDMLVPNNGTLIVLQNTTWNGMQGFQKDPRFNQLYVPYHPEYNFGAQSGAGILGTWGTERGLTNVDVEFGGHSLPQYTPGAAFRMLELLLGRIENLSQVSDFTTQTGNFTGSSPFYKRAEIPPLRNYLKDGGFLRR
ncbi:hypothetical protein MMC25_007910 [Agyrium rufum]|nr:hypothetical protein [Agyrium rufum]